MYAPRSSRPIISCTAGAESCIARATFAPVIGRPASCSQNSVSRYRARRRCSSAVGHHGDSSERLRLRRRCVSGSSPSSRARPRRCRVGPQWCYEQKYDGFRAIAFVERRAAACSSRAGQGPHALLPGAALPAGELRARRRDRDRRRRPAARRSARCSSASTPPPRGSSASPRELPACFVAFDLLELDGEDCSSEPFERRRAALERLAGVRRSELVRDPAAAQRWLEETEGVVAKRLDAAYAPGKRTAMVKVKRLRTIDCVVMRLPARRRRPEPSAR